MTAEAKVRVEIERNEQIFSIDVPCYDIRTPAKSDNQKQNTWAWTLMDYNVGYLDAGKLEIQDVGEIMSELQHARSIIIDLRKYPRFGAIDTLLNKYLSPISKQFCLIRYPNPDIPGTFYYSSNFTIGPKVFNSNHYQGEVVILVSEYTGSQSEFVTMKLQTLANAYTIGRQTAGSDGNVTYVQLPGGLRAMHSGIGVHYPDSSQTQRVGVRIDQIVKRRIDDLLTGNDEILEAAINFLKSK